MAASTERFYTIAFGGNMAPLMAAGQASVRTVREDVPGFKLHVYGNLLQQPQETHTLSENQSNPNQS